MFRSSTNISADLLNLQDTVFEFEKKRNVPVKYDRALVTETVKAMKRVEDLREARQKAFWEKRMTVKKVHERAEAKFDLEKNIELIELPAATLSKQAKAERDAAALLQMQAEPEKIKIKAKTKKAAKNAMSDS
eukprot:TRINITY_DN1399_c0_g1_i1.p1 TRINITY_DN1399_c0_g1~~TRINITY_DN1399_c0_g1_i1.p1  ORF type:complete len:133 (-),score=34.35 TRINITY_DN1399_c0_g1_i1:184-582(-)